MVIYLFSENSKYFTISNINAAYQSTSPATSVSIFTDDKTIISVYEDRYTASTNALTNCPFGMINGESKSIKLNPLTLLSLFDSLPALRSALVTFLSSRPNRLST